jgi:cbb3-type cytochrome oxidase subunit 1
MNKQKQETPVLSYRLTPQRLEYWRLIREHVEKGSHHIGDLPDAMVMDWMLTLAVANIKDDKLIHA